MTYPTCTEAIEARVREAATKPRQIILDLRSVYPESEIRRTIMRLLRERRLWLDGDMQLEERPKDTL